MSVSQLISATACRACSRFYEQLYTCGQGDMGRPETRGSNSIAKFMERQDTATWTGRWAGRAEHVPRAAPTEPAGWFPFLCALLGLHTRGPSQLFESMVGWP